MIRILHWANAVKQLDELLTHKPELLEFTILKKVWAMLGSTYLSNWNAEAEMEIGYPGVVETLSQHVDMSGLIRRQKLTTTAHDHVLSNLGAICRYYNEVRDNQHFDGSPRFDPSRAIMGILSAVADIPPAFSAHEMPSRVYFPTYDL